MTAETWKDIAGYEGLYQVSNLGNVRNARLRKLKIVYNEKGYSYVSLFKEQKVKRFRVHRLVAKAFIKNPFDLQEVNHIDGNKKKNTVDNLEWTSRSGNNFHKVEVLRKTSYLDNKPRGIFQKSGSSLYVARIEARKKKIYIGCFQSKEEAYGAYFEEFKKIRGYEPWDLEKYPTHKKAISCN